MKALKNGQEILIPRGNTPISNTSHYIPSQLIQVKKGETLFSISQAHSLTVDELVKANQLKDHHLSLGQKLFIPAINLSKGSSESKPETPSSVKSNGSLLKIPENGTYTVGPGETIYSIGFKYGVGVDDIRQMNQIQNNEIKIGQVLRLKPESSPILEAPKAPITESKVNSPVREVPNKSDKPENKEVPVKIMEPPLEAHRSKTIPREFKEEGMGIWVDNNDLNQAKSVALHKQAPVGTVIKVTNPMTRRSIFVKVVGSFPETEETKNAILVISKSAAKLIGALDPHFRVELTYAY